MTQPDANTLHSEYVTDTTVVHMDVADLDPGYRLAFVGVLSRHSADPQLGLPHAVDSPTFPALKDVEAFGHIWLYVPYRPPRYRFLYDHPVGMPPLRQFPRDDALGGAPREGHLSRSVQASARQGWSGTYR